MDCCLQRWIDDRMVQGETRVKIEAGWISFTKFHLTTNDTLNHTAVIQICPLRTKILTIMLQNRCSWNIVGKANHRKPSRMFNSKLLSIHVWSNMIIREWEMICRRDTSSRTGKEGRGFPWGQLWHRAGIRGICGITISGWGRWNCIQIRIKKRPLTRDSWSSLDILTGQKLILCRKSRSSCWVRLTGQKLIRCRKSRSSCCRKSADKSIDGSCWNSCIRIIVSQT